MVSLGRYWLLFFISRLMSSSSLALKGTLLPPQQSSGMEGVRIRSPKDNVSGAISPWRLSTVRRQARNSSVAKGFVR